jgi:hypothetical protein
MIRTFCGLAIIFLILGMVIGYSEDLIAPLPVLIPYITTIYRYTPIVLLLGDAVVFSFKMRL